MLDGNWNLVIENGIEIGDVVWGAFVESEEFTAKNGCFSPKMFVVLGKDVDGAFFGVGMINSDPRVNQGPVKISHLQHLLQKTKYSFLKHDSYVNCAKIWDRHIDKVIEDVKKDYKKKCGHLDRIDLDQVLELVRNSTTIKPIDKKRYGLMPTNF